MVLIPQMNSRSLNEGIGRDKDTFTQQKKKMTVQSFPNITNALYIYFVYIYKLSNFVKLKLQDMYFIYTFQEWEM